MGTRAGWPALLLWDIDGTLIRGGRATSEAFHQALRSVYRLEGEIARIDTSGKTDGQIVVETLAEHGVTAAAAIERLADFRECYFATLLPLRSRLTTELTILPGVAGLLLQLSELGLWQSLLTGNIEPAARLKLGCVGLDHHFDFAVGAFGSDHLDRNRFVQIALDKIRASRERHLEPQQVIVIGDTPRDIACARAAGAYVIAVATGHYSTDALAEHRPDALLTDLSDRTALLAALKSIAQ